jgi:glutamate carboxypeptidase
MLLIGHLDTVFEPDSPFQRWTRKGDEGEGPGAGDDKGGMAVMIAALRAMQAAGTLKGADIMVVLTGDEEDSGNPIEVARRDLIAAGKWADVALDYEGLVVDGGKDMGSIARRSSGSWTVTVKAKTGHSSGVFSQGAGFGANYELARILDSFRRELREDKLTYNVGLVGGGTSAALCHHTVRGSGVRPATSTNASTTAMPRNRPKIAPRKRSTKPSPAACTTRVSGQAISAPAINAPMTMSANAMM